jgi:hypothetical protein
MGILDEAIRDHLELKRRGGAQETDLQRLEDEAFGPPSRPGDAAAAVAAPAEAPETLKREPSPPGGGEEAPAAPETAPESRETAPAEEAGEEPAAQQIGGAFHDFAAEEGLVTPGAEAPAAPAEPEAPEPEEPAREEPTGEEPAPEGAPPAQEASLDDTQPHDMQAEMGEVEPPAPGEASAPPSGDLEIGDEDLELRLDDDDEPRPSGDLRVVEEEDEEVVVEDVEVEEVAEGGDEEGDDVLEETPDFLRETPEHDRLWFEQKPPKDFDFDE